MEKSAALVRAAIVVHFRARDTPATGADAARRGAARAGSLRWFLYIYFSFFNNQKLISYIISIKLFSTNTLINVNTIKGNPKFFYSAGMFNLQKTQKIRQPKAVITILRALLLKSKAFKTKPVAVHFNNLFFNHQSYIFKKLNQKIFTKLVISYVYRSHNGCRLKKKKRIKIRTRTRKL